MFPRVAKKASAHGLCYNAVVLKKKKNGKTLKKIALLWLILAKTGPGKHGATPKIKFIFSEITERDHKLSITFYLTYHKLTEL